MKRIIILFALMVISLPAFQQSVPSITKESKEVLPVLIFEYVDRFEEFYYYDEYLHYIYDSLDIIQYNALGLDTLWCAGTPNKSEWNIDYLLISLPKVLITDSINSYPTNIHSVMEFHIEKPEWTQLYGFCWSNLIFGFSFACNTDTLKDGFYLEISFDGGNSFVNVMNEDAVLNTENGPDEIGMTNFSQSSVLRDSIPGYSGLIYNSDEWIQGENVYSYMESLSFEYWWDNVNGHIVDEAIVRLHFISDSIDSGKQGVMIDNVIIDVVEWCNYIGISDDSNVCDAKIYPNPISDNSILRFRNDESLITEIIIYSSMGKEVYRYKTTNNEFNLGNIDFASGVYTAIILNKNYNKNIKFVKH